VTIEIDSRCYKNGDFINIVNQTPPGSNNNAKKLHLYSVDGVFVNVNIVPFGPKCPK